MSLPTARLVGAFNLGTAGVPSTTVNYGEPFAESREQKKEAICLLFTSPLVKMRQTASFALFW